MFIILWGVTKKDWDQKQEVKSEWGLFHFWSLIGVATKMQTRRFLFSRKTAKRGTCLMVKGYWQSVFLRCRFEMMKCVYIFCVILLIIWVRDKECETHDLTKSKHLNKNSNVLFGWLCVWQRKTERPKPKEKKTKISEIP